ncbi:PHP domain-containing protein [Priestia flexa]|uniref:PHP domain-containing protein n=1 Tax=Priestia flexa TaxID=86664 RepID=UPI003FD4DDC7
MQRFAFHTHTNYSWDCDIKLIKLYKELKKKQIDGIAITDHNEIEGAKKFAEKYGNEINVIIGEEIMTTQGEIIGLYINEKIPKGLSPKETIKRIKDQGGIVYIPHPFDTKRFKSCLETDFIHSNLDDIDIIEVFNGRCVNIQDCEKAKLLNASINKVEVCGSDAHTCRELNFNLIQFHTKEKVTKDNLLELLRNRSSFYNLKTNKLVHQYTKYVKLKKLLKKGEFDAILRLIYKRSQKIKLKISQRNKNQRV